MKRFVVIYMAVMLFAGYAMAGTWTELNMPGIDSDVSLAGIGSNMIVGWFGSSPLHGIVYNMLTGAYLVLDKPGASLVGLRILDVENDNLIGYYYDDIAHYHWRGFIYNLTEHSWTTLDVPEATYTEPKGIDANTIVGVYQKYSNLFYGFSYDITTGEFTTLDGPENMYVTGISGDKVVGFYGVIVNSNWHGFIYDMTNHSWITLDKPGANDTVPQDIDGNYIIGSYNSSRSFLYNISTDTWSSIYTDGGSDNIFPAGIDDNKISFNIGQYGSVYTISGTLPVVPDCVSPIGGDVNGDCKVTLADYAIIAPNWLDNITLADFEIMASNWLDCNLEPQTACWW